ncbi:MAG: hypothetical protein KatS3mg060_2841 [Dehalococcoidia bacterium]|nr:MAG: hypothetical protein KatS3mg060_2841 [Dehalococcoidia bacterium]
MKLDRGATLVALVSLVAWAPLLTDGYFLRAHDAAHSLIFVNQFEQSLRDGAILPRWGPDFAFGYGYPLFVVYNPLSAALAGLLSLAGLGTLGGVKAVYLLGFVTSGLTMYLFARALFGTAAGVLAGVLYIYAPYRLVDVYVRSAAAEAFSFVFPPIVLWAAYRLDRPRAPRWRYILAGGLALGGLVLTHNGMTAMVVPLLAGWSTFLLTRRAWRLRSRLPLAARSVVARSVSLALLGILALAVSAAFWVPLVAEFRYVKGDQWTGYPFADHFVFPFQLLSPAWEYGFSGPGPRDEMPFQLGVLLVVLGLLACSRLGRARDRGTVLFFLGATTFAVFLLSPPALVVWQALPLGSALQFPWRLLGLVALTTAVLGGAAVPALADRFTPAWSALNRRPALLAPLLLLAVVASQAYAIPQATPVTEADVGPCAVVDFESKWENRTGAMVYATEIPTTSPLVEQYRSGRPLQKAVASDPDAIVTMLHHGGSSDIVRVSTPRPTELTFLTYDFPGWTISLDGERVAHRRVGPYGLIAIDVPAGEHVIAARFQHTPVRLVGELVSGVTLLGCLGAVLVLRRRQRPVTDG